MNNRSDISKTEREDIVLSFDPSALKAQWTSEWTNKDGEVWDFFPVLIIMSMFVKSLSHYQVEVLQSSVVNDSRVTTACKLSRLFPSLLLSSIP